MKRSSFISRKFTVDQQLQKLPRVVSLTVSNYGNTDLILKVNDVERVVPAFNPAYGVPFGAFNLPGDGTYSDITLEFAFAGGKGNAILDYRILIDECAPGAVNG